MPNLLQTAFVSSSVVAFGTLFVLSKYLTAFSQAQPADNTMSSVLAPYLEYVSSPSSMALILGGGFSLGIAWLLSVKHTRKCCLTCFRTRAVLNRTAIHRPRARPQAR